MKTCMLSIFCLILIIPDISICQVLSSNGKTDTLQNQATIESIKVFYWDSITNSNSKTYREMHKIGDSEYFSKPTEIDVQISFQNLLNDGIVQVIIEELLEPKKILARNTPELNQITARTWVLPVSYTHL